MYEGSAVRYTAAADEGKTKCGYIHTGPRIYTIDESTTAFAQYAVRYKIASTLQEGIFDVHLLGNHYIPHVCSRQFSNHRTFTHVIKSGPFLPERTFLSFSGSKNTSKGIFVARLQLRRTWSPSGVVLLAREIAMYLSAAADCSAVGGRAITIETSAGRPPSPGRSTLGRGVRPFVGVCYYAPCAKGP